MISCLFSFRESIGRLSFLVWTLAGLVPHSRWASPWPHPASRKAALSQGDGFPPVLLGTTILMMPVALLSVWSTLALHTKRIRDIGLPPALVLGGVIIFAAIDHLLIAGLTRARFVEPFEQSTPIGGAFFIAYTVMILLWPGAGSSPLPKTTGNPMSRLSGFADQIAQVSATAGPSPRRSAARQAGFGRRAA